MTKNFSPRHHLPHYSWILFRSISEPVLVYFALIINLLVLVACGLFYWFESPVNTRVNSLFDSLWWTLTTITTVGYGDIVPVTVPGRIVALALMASGLVSFVGYTALLITVFSSYLTEKLTLNERIQNKELLKILKEIENIKRQLQK